MMPSGFMRSRKKYRCKNGECVLPDNPCEELHGKCTLDPECPEGYGQAPLGGGIHCNWSGTCCLIECLDENMACPYDLDCIDGLCIK